MTKQTKKTTTYRKKTLDPKVDLAIKKDKDDIENIEDYWQIAESVLDDTQGDIVEDNTNTVNIGKESVNTGNIEEEESIISNMEEESISNNIEGDVSNDSNLDDTLFNLKNIRESLSVKKCSIPENTSGFDVSYEIADKKEEQNEEDISEVDEEDISEVDEEDISEVDDGINSEVDDGINSEIDENIGGVDDGMSDTIDNLVEEERMDMNKKKFKSSDKKVKSSDKKVRSPSKKVRSPSKKVRSPSKKVRSPSKKVRSPSKKVNSSSKRIKSSNKRIKSMEEDNTSILPNSNKSSTRLISKKGEEIGRTKVTSLYSGKSKLKGLVIKKEIETGILFLNKKSSIKKEIPSNTFSMYVIKGKVKVVLEKEEYLVDRESVFIIEKGSEYSMYDESYSGSTILMSYAIF